MSQASLQSFLQKLQKELESSKTFREETEIEAHSFYLSRGRLLSEVYKQLNADGVTFDPELVKKEVGKYFRTWERKAEGLIARGSRSGIDTRISRVKRGGWINLVFVSRSEQNIFKKIKRHKQSAQKDFHNYLQTIYKESWDASNFLDITHEQTSVISRQRVQVAQTKLDQFLNTLPASDLNILKQDNTIKLKLIKDDQKDLVSVSLGSAHYNRSQGSTADKKFLIDANKRLTRALNKLSKTLIVTKGSDSFETKRKKQAIKAVTDPFKKVKGAKVRTEDTKIKKSSKKAVESSIKAKVKQKSASTIDTPVKIRIRKKGKPSTVSLKALIPQINMRLREAVAANMGSPALNYRTGRFASSVKVMDITRTPKGFPSVAYTYQRDPYQVFEHPGGSPRLATPDRDPRNLIDKSIRDVAIGMLDQRFFTRRV